MTALFPENSNGPFWPNQLGYFLSLFTIHSRKSFDVIKVNNCKKTNTFLLHKNNLLDSSTCSKNKLLILVFVTIFSSSLFKLTKLQRDSNRIICSYLFFLTTFHLLLFSSRRMPWLENNLEVTENVQFFWIFSIIFEVILVYFSTISRYV